MKIEIIGDIVKLTAEDGMAIREIGQEGPSQLLAKEFKVGVDTPDRYEDCERGNPEPYNDTRYYAVDLLSAIGDVVGAERYDGIKAALSATRIGGVPVWDMLISGMFIPATDPRLATIRTALVDAELVSNEEFDKILALAASDEPVSESGAAEG